MYNLETGFTNTGLSKTVKWIFDYMKISIFCTAKDAINSQ